MLLLLHVTSLKGGLKMEETITVKVEDLQNLWKELDDLYADIVEIEKQSCRLVSSSKLDALQDLSLDIYGSRKAVKVMRSSVCKLLGMEE